MRTAHNCLRIAPEEESDRTAVRAPGAGVQNSAVFCARSVRTAVRSRRRCPADTFGTTFCHQKVVKIFLQEIPEEKVGMFPTLSQPDSVKKYAFSAAAEERQPAGTSSAGRGLTNGGRGIYSRQSVYDSRTALQGVLPKTTESVIPDKGNDARKSSTGTPRYPRRATPFRSVLPATTFRFGRIAVRSIAF